MLQPSFKMHPECRLIVGEYLNAVCDWCKSHQNSDPLPPDIIELRKAVDYEYGFSRSRRTASAAYRSVRDVDGRRYDRQEARYRNSLFPEKHLVAARRWRDNNREFKRALDRYAYWRKKASREALIRTVSAARERLDAFGAIQVN